MAQIEKIKDSPEAFAAFAEKLNEIITEMNARDMEAGPGLSLIRSDKKTIIGIGSLTGTLTCTETGGTIEISGS